LIERLAHAGTWVSVFLMLSGVLGAWQSVFANSRRARLLARSKGYVQIAQLALWLVCGVLVLSILIDRSPLWMLSGIGALSAVLLLVFKDTLLSMVATPALTSNDVHAAYRRLDQRCRNQCRRLCDGHCAAVKVRGQHRHHGADLQAVLGELSQLPSHVRVRRAPHRSARCVSTPRRCGSWTMRGQGADALSAAARLSGGSSSRKWNRPIGRCWAKTPTPSIAAD
jgi:hypothetical protein